MKKLLAGAAALGILAAAGSAQAAGEFDGVTINVMTQTGAIQEPLQRRAPEFEALTGAKVNVIAVPFVDLYQKVLTDWASGTNSVDAAVFAPQWMVDYVAGGYLEDLTPRIAADPAIEEEDVGAFFRDFSQKYGDKTYMITLDGDFHMMYYRTDVLEAAGKKPPTTWDEYLDVAAAVHGQDMNGDGTPDFGSCIGKKRNAAELLVHHRRDRLDDPVEGHEPGHLLQHRRHDAAGRQRGLPQGARVHVGVDPVRPAGRAQPRRRRHPAALRLRPLRAQPRLGRRRHHLHRPEPVEGDGQVGRGDHAGLEGGARLGDRQARRLRRRRPARTPSTA